MNPATRTLSAPLCKGEQPQPEPYKRTSSTVLMASVSDQTIRNRLSMVCVTDHLLESVVTA